MELFNNYVAMTLAVAALAGDTSITVNDASALPLGGNYRLMVDSEIMLATSRTGNVISVTRGQESTVATAHAFGVAVVPAVTAGALVAALAGAGGGGSIAWQYSTGAAPAIVVPSSAIPQGVWFHGVSSPGSVALPSSPTDGETLDLVDEDGTAVNQGITISGGHNILAPDGTSASSYVFSTAAHGYAAGAETRLLYSALRGVWKVIR